MFSGVNSGLHATRKQSCLFPDYDSLFFFCIFNVLMMSLVTVAIEVF